MPDESDKSVTKIPNKIETNLDIDEEIQDWLYDGGIFLVEDILNNVNRVEFKKGEKRRKALYKKESMLGIFKEKQPEKINLLDYKLIGVPDIVLTTQDHKLLPCPLCWPTTSSMVDFIPIAIGSKESEDFFIFYLSICDACKTTLWCRHFMTPTDTRNFIFSDLYQPQNKEPEEKEPSSADYK